MAAEITAAISVTAAVCGIIFGLVTFFRNKREDDNRDGKKDGVVLTELGYIKSGVDDIKRKQEKQEQQHIEVVSRLTAVEASAKQAHKRIDAIEGRRNSDE